MFSVTTWKWIALTIVVLALILVPFFLFETQIEAWTSNFIESAEEYRVLVGLVLGGLLAADIFLPTPSSLVSTGIGFFLGFIPGMLVSWAAMCISCAIGYWIAVWLGRPVATKFVGDEELDKLHNLYGRIGDWVIVVLRPVPVLAEASVLFAGMARMPFRRFMLLAGLSNLGISAVYSAVGAYSATVNSFLLVFAAAILVPAIGMLATRGLRRESAEGQVQ
ncbi:TVP38/TMEM64 family protein [Chloroflexota bacterium]